MMKQLAVFVLAPALICGVANGEDSFLFIESGQSFGDASSFNVALGDLNGDGSLDAWITNVNEPDAVWINNGSGSFDQTDQLLQACDGFDKIYEECNNTRDVVLKDFDGDTDLDALVGQSAFTLPGDHQLWINRGDGQFLLSPFSSANYLNPVVDAGDIDGDGDEDILTNIITGLIFWKNDGNNQFSSSQSISVNNPLYQSTSLTDMDSDGHLDLVLTTSQLTGWGGGLITATNLYFNDGTGLFPTSTFLSSSSGSTRVAVGDLDSDGDSDLWMAWTSAGTSQLKLNDGNGSFTTENQLTGSYAERLIELGDIDGDGYLDAVVVTQNNELVIWRNNQGNPSSFDRFMSSLIRSVPTTTSSIALGDIDSDGDMDIWLTNSSGSDLLLLNDSKATQKCIGDITGDGQTNGQDLAQILANWGTSTGNSDLNSDGDVDGADLTILLSYWGQCP